jgi:hypothetical protein
MRSRRTKVSRRESLATGFYGLKRNVEVAAGVDVFKGLLEALAVCVTLSGEKMWDVRTRMRRFSGRRNRAVELGPFACRPSLAVNAGRVEVVAKGKGAERERERNETKDAG